MSSILETVKVVRDGVEMVINKSDMTKEDKKPAPKKESKKDK